ARPHQPRFRRRPFGDAGDGQGDDGHGRGRWPEPRARSGRTRHRQPAARWRVDAGCPRRDHLAHRRRRHEAARSRRSGQPYPRTGRSQRQHYSGFGLQSGSRWQDPRLGRGHGYRAERRNGRTGRAPAQSSRRLARSGVPDDGACRRARTRAARAAGSRARSCSDAARGGGRSRTGSPRPHARS
ncbi:hypothetical protein OY671_010149, partial [Metschnikowia pulcherrima]